MTRALIYIYVIMCAEHSGFDARTIAEYVVRRFCSKRKKDGLCAWICLVLIKLLHQFTIAPRRLEKLLRQRRRRADGMFGEHLR